MTLQELLKVKQNILKVAKKHGAFNVRVFGSVVRGESTNESDIDVLVDLEAGRSLLDHAALKLELEELLSCKVDVITEKGLRTRIKEKILKEAVSL